MSRFAPVLLPLLAALLAQVSGLTQTLGAHPFWSGKVIWIGLVLGLGLAGLLRLIGLSRMPATVLAALLAASAFLLAQAGKSGFAASYGENALAGRFWFFNWIATCAFVAAMLASLMRKTGRSH